MWNLFKRRTAARGSDPEQLRIVAIVGLYKCGTSWLSLALGKHPSVLALPEFDVVRAFADESAAGLKARPREERLRYIFGSTNYGRLPIDVVSAAAQQDPGQLYDFLIASASKRVNLKNSFVQDAFNPASNARLRGHGTSIDSFVTFWTLDEESAHAIVQTIDEPDVRQAIRRFCLVHQRFAGPTAHLALKSADQINHLALLEQCLPEAKRIAIIRDGRDMANSAIRFEDYIRRRTHFEGVWGVQQFDYWDRLRHWVDAARKIRAEKEKGGLYVLRYEDLLNDFAGTVRPLLDWLELERTDAIVAKMEQGTTFEVMSGGRKRGEESAGSNIRRGIAGEWREILDADGRARAREIASRELEYFGYE